MTKEEALREFEKNGFYVKDMPSRADYFYAGWVACAKLLLTKDHGVIVDREVTTVPDPIDRYELNEVDA